MRVCPDLHTAADLDGGHFASPVPLPLTRSLTSCYGRFNDPKRNGYNPNYRWGDDDDKVGHKGNDLGLNLNGPVTAMADGTVGSVNLDDNGDAGVWVSLLHKCPECPGWFLTRHLHFVVGSIVVKLGQKVVKGEKLGRGDTTGNAHWPHVHLDLRHSGIPTANLVPSGVSPSSWFGPRWGKPFDPQAWKILDYAPPPVSVGWVLDPVTADRPRLRFGDAGRPVKELQSLLQILGSGITPTGTFDTTTRSAVMAFQAMKGLTADGIVGKNTWTALLDY